MMPNLMKMEDYENFCKKQLARIQGESIQKGISPPAQHKNISLIHFNGVPVLSPLLTLERKKELQQDRKKAVDLELWRQNSKKIILLNRVQEIVENVQMKKLSSQHAFDQFEMENIHTHLKSKVANGFKTQSNSALPSSTALGGFAEPKIAPEVKPTDLEVALNGDSLGRTEQFIPHKPKDTCSSLSEKRVCPEGASSDPTQMSPLHETVKKDSIEIVSADTEGPDPCMMSLQNLLKKSREYIQREQTRRSLRSNSRRNGSESHSDKENDAVKTSDAVKERGKLTGRSGLAAAPDKSSLTKSGTSLQSTSVAKNNTSVTSTSFSKVDIPVRSGTPPVLDSSEDLRNTSFFEHNSSILQSFTGSYSRLPSPELSMSPKMHRRRPRPSSMGHIVINHPVNAYELSPKEKGRAADQTTQDAGSRQSASDLVPALAADLAPICPSKVHVFCKSSSDICDELGFEKQNQVCQPLVGQRENKRLPVSATVEVALISGDRGVSSPCLSDPSAQDTHAVNSVVATQSKADVTGATQTGLLDQAKSSPPMELNKSYDVESPSPLLIQTHQEQMDTPNESLGNEPVLENGFEKVKRRLELDADNAQKENMPCDIAAETNAREKRWLPGQRCSEGPAFGSKREAPGRSVSAEETFKQKMLAFEELRKRLEEQHAQQLSLLIAEQEREQERLQKEIEEQEWRLKGEKTAVTKMDIPQIAISSRMDLEWRKISDTQLLESVLTRVETIHSTNSESAGFANASISCSTADSPFYLWEPPAHGKSVAASRSISRSRMRWSQVYSPEMKRKLNKISALAKGFLTRRLLQTEKLKHLRQTVKDTMEFIKNFQTEAPLKRGSVSAQDANLQERVAAQLRAALYDIHDIFFKMDVSERMSILCHDREVRKEKMLRQLDKAKAPRERVTLSTATQKSLDRKKYMKASEMGMPNRKTIVKQKTPENRVLQPNQGQNAPIQRLLSRQGTPKTSVKGAEQNRKKPSESRVSNKAFSGVYAGRIQRKKPNAVTT
ncbi:centriolar coiled-coil protein of 110 kDa isoform X1 [Varanus komodoensis]|uniref:centriolar coiled-coil protein of 110 kDa isoform X1 n=2 Tax=Varanus komodoensis TaxID=61221 RepID=UPI001CF7B59A|nr:centriolar coiled-coil protein of 110 kDa isoform X1 [Varanus komodoensis]